MTKEDMIDAIVDAMSRWDEQSIIQWALMERTADLNCLEKEDVANIYDQECVPN